MDSHSLHAEPWRWRLRLARRLAAELDGERLGVRAVYLIGSTKNTTAGPDSDIDLIFHVIDEPQRRELLKRVLARWDRRLCDVHRRLTGRELERVLDAHFVTDEDIQTGNSFTAMIGAVSDAARPLPMTKRWLMREKWAEE